EDGSVAALDGHLVENGAEPEPEECRGQEEAEEERGQGEGDPVSHKHRWSFRVRPRLRRGSGRPAGAWYRPGPRRRARGREGPGGRRDRAAWEPARMPLAAGVAELADARDLGSRGREAVQVRFLSPALGAHGS